MTYEIFKEILGFAKDMINENRFESLQAFTHSDKCFTFEEHDVRESFNLENMSVLIKYNKTNVICLPAESIEYIKVNYKEYEPRS